MRVAGKSNLVKLAVSQDSAGCACAGAAMLVVATITIVPAKAKRRFVCVRFFISGHPLVLSPA
jgi:hypothetical protein